jgi:hypothetical protein
MTSLENKEIGLSFKTDDIFHVPTEVFILKKEILSLIEQLDQSIKRKNIGSECDEVTKLAIKARQRVYS